MNIKLNSLNAIGLNTSGKYTYKLEGVVLIMWGGIGELREYKFDETFTFTDVHTIIDRVCSELIQINTNLKQKWETAKNTEFFTEYVKKYKSWNKTDQVKYYPLFHLSIVDVDSFKTIESTVNLPFIPKENNKTALKLFRIPIKIKSQDLESSNFESVKLNIKECINDGFLETIIENQMEDEYNPQNVCNIIDSIASHHKLSNDVVKKVLPCKIGDLK